MSLTLTATDADTRPYEATLLDGVLSERNVAGATFNNGLLRFHNAASAELAQQNLYEFFSDRASELTPFAVDWRGRHFCRVQLDGEDMALRADSAFNEASPLTDYAGTVAFLLDDPGAAEFLEEAVMQEAFAALQIFGLPFTDCIGLKVPAFLGGEETIANMEVNDMDVYWSFNAQVYNQVKDTPPGTPIRLG